MHFVLPLLKYAVKSAGTETGDIFEVPPNVSKGIVYLYCNTASGTGASAAIRIQGGPGTGQSNAWLTGIPMFVSQNPTGGVAGSAAFTAVTAGGLQIRYMAFVPPFLRAINVMAGSSGARATLGVQVALFEG